MTGLCIALLSATTAQSTPLTNTRDGALALSGPAVAHPASVLLNPAALSLIRARISLYASGLFQLQQTSITRAAIDATNGQPLGGGQTLPEESSLLPALPQFMFGASFRLLDSFVLGLTVHAPALQRYSILRAADGELFDAALQTTSRNHGVALTLFRLRFNAAIALKIAKGWWIGASTGWVYHRIDYAFVRDRALDGGSSRDSGEPIALDDCADGQRCDYEADRAAEAVRVTADLDSVDFSLGIVGRVHRNVTIGLGYVSRPFDIRGVDLSAEGDAYVRRAPATIDAALQDPDINTVARNLRGRATVLFQMPHQINAGVHWRLSPRFALDLQLRWTMLREHQALDVRLTGAQLRREPQVPDRAVHFRGFRDAFAVQLGGVVRLTRRVALDLALMVQSGAVRRSTINSIAIDNWKLDNTVAMRVDLGAGFTLQAGYGLVIIPAMTIDNSAFRPSFTVDCVDSRFNVDLSQCDQAADGRGLASTNGRYSMLMHRFGGALGYKWR